MSLRFTYSALICTAIAIAACATQSPAAPAVAPQYDPVAVNDGALVADRECSRCHATGIAGPSPRRDAPEFRHILSRYHSDTLETELVEGIKLGHPDMPQFQLNPKGVDDLIVYLKSIQQ